MSILLYIFKTFLVSGLLYLYYWLFLRNKQFHQYNRFYLLGLIPFSLILPLLNIPIPFAGNSAHAAGKILHVLSVNEWEEAVTITPGHNALELFFTWQNITAVLYFLVSGLMICLLIRSLHYVLHLSKKYHWEETDGIKIFQTTEPAAPFSFFSNIFWNMELNIQSDAGAQIFRHELYHVRKKHSLDVLFLEIVTCFCWFNPFYHLVKKETKTIHEFLADEYAASESDRHGYAELLVWQTINVKQLNIIHPFFHNHIKRRIIMITKFKMSHLGYINRMMALPVFFILFCAFAVKLTARQTETATAVFAKELTLVIDAGHGGIDPGTRSAKGLLEKNINLSIAKKIREQGKNYHINVVMTRDEDILPGNASNIEQGLINRLDIAALKKAEFMISIHTNAEALRTGTAHGFEIYVPNKTAYGARSVQLGSAVSEEIKKTFPISPDLKQAQVPIRILQSATIPTIMIECGYMTNEDDLAFITNEKNQEKIASDILEGVVKYVNSSPAPNNAAPIIVTQTNSDYQVTPATKKDIYTKVEIEPEYPGGAKGWLTYLNKNFVYPEKAIKNGIQGTVLTQFVVNAEGNVSDIRILESPNKLLSDETIRIIKKSGKWIPAENAGHKVNSYKKQPIIFKLQSAG